MPPGSPPKARADLISRPMTTAAGRARSGRRGPRPSVTARRIATPAKTRIRPAGARGRCSRDALSLPTSEVAPLRLLRMIRASSCGEAHGCDANLHRRLPLRRGALRGNGRSRQCHELQLLDLQQARCVVDLRQAGAIRPALGRGLSHRVPLQQESGRAPVLHRVRRRVFRARQDAGWIRCGWPQRALPRRRRHRGARGQAFRRAEPVARTRRRRNRWPFCPYLGGVLLFCREVHMVLDRRSVLAAFAALLTAPAAAQAPAAPAAAAETSASPAAGMTRVTAYAFSFAGLNGGQIRLIEHAGKPILIVNTASRCGFTPQYAGLQELWTRFRDRGLLVVGVPSNDFGGQEPGGPDEIARTANEHFGAPHLRLGGERERGAD